MFLNNSEKRFIIQLYQGIFLDYDEINHIAYRIYDIDNNKIILS